jgi:Domain of unknown function (DUF305)
MHRYLSFSPRLALLALALIGGATSLATTMEARFLAENGAAMARMMAAMNVKPSGDVDADFVAAMVPHHQGAIDMAQAQLRYGRNEQLRRIAQEIIVTQQEEIAAMRLAIGQPLSQSTPSPDHPTSHSVNPYTGAGL